MAKPNFLLNRLMPRAVYVIKQEQQFGALVVHNVLSINVLGKFQGPSAFLHILY